MAADPRVKAGYAIDPVDWSFNASLGPSFPSALAALSGSGLAMGLTGASSSGLCNPEWLNHQACRDAGWWVRVTGCI